MTGACDVCARRAWLLGRLAGHLEIRRADRGAIRQVLALSDERLIEALGGRDRARLTIEFEQADPSALRAAWSASGCTAICRHDERYPPGLHDLTDPPTVLFALGDPARVGGLLGSGGTGDRLHQVAVVGARRASADGQATARALGRGLSAAGVTVVSGMALGIDSAAHEGALEAGARTAAVLACGPEHAYPPRRRPLHRRLVERGARDLRAAARNDALPLGVSGAQPHHRGARRDDRHRRGGRAVRFADHRGDRDRPRA